jgi:integrase
LKRRPKKAEEDRIIPRNRCRVTGAGQEESGEREMVRLPVIFKIAEAVPVRYRCLVLLATFADMRWGELAGLRRGNIDLGACEIRITETLAQLDKARVTVTGRSRRLWARSSARCQMPPGNRPKTANGAGKAHDIGHRCGTCAARAT